MVNWRSMAFVASILLAPWPTVAQEARTVHAIAIHGEPKYPADFTHLDYVNPDAPKGGTAKFSAFGSYDSFNQHIIQGDPAAGLGQTGITLTTSTQDEAATEYGVLAETMEVPDDRSWIIFNLRPEAVWHDGKPITAEDVKWTFEALIEKGSPFYRAYFGSVKSVDVLGDHRVRFDFGDEVNNEMPVIIGQMPVLPKHYWETRDLGKPTREVPLGGGPYKVESFDMGRSITYERVKDWWAADLPINRGRHNYDRMVYEYYRDATVTLEAFKAGEFDIRFENSSKNWATAYDFPAARDGLVKLEQIDHELPSGMQGFVFNTRRGIFADPKVREALAYAFDFEWTNKNLMYDAYARTKSYFANTELASTGLPQEGTEEYEILDRYRDRLPERVFTETYSPPESDGSGNIRGNLRTAVSLLQEAGWRFEGKKLVDRDGKPFTFQILLRDATFERHSLPFVQNLARLGIEATVRVVDSAQYQNRLDSYDFDMIIQSFGQSLSPGNEQRDFWHSEKADIPGSRNVMGVRDPVIDDLIDLVISAPDRDSLIQRTRALDRVLLWSFYVIPQWHSRNFRIAYWDKFDQPEIRPKYGLGFGDLWWVNEAKAQKLAEARKGLN